jgi:hypothetical protein
LDIDYDNDTIEEIVEKVEYAIEQHASFLKVIPAEEIKEQEELNKLRKVIKKNKVLKFKILNFKTFFTLKIDFNSL